MVITYKYIMKYRTIRGAWTGPQMEALGLHRCKEPTGWIKRIAGNKLSEKNRVIFESRVTQATKEKLIENIKGNKNHSKLELAIKAIDILDIDDLKSIALYASHQIKKEEWAIKENLDLKHLESISGIH